MEGILKGSGTTGMGPLCGGLVMLVSGLLGVRPNRLVQNQERAIRFSSSSYDSGTFRNDVDNVQGQLGKKTTAPPEYFPASLWSHGKQKLLTVMALLGGLFSAGAGIYQVNHPTMVAVSEPYSNAAKEAFAPSLAAFKANGGQMSEPEFYKALERLQNDFLTYEKEHSRNFNRSDLAKLNGIGWTDSMTVSKAFRDFMYKSFGENGLNPEKVSVADIKALDIDKGFLENSVYTNGMNAGQRKALADSLQEKFLEVYQSHGGMVGQSDFADIFRTAFVKFRGLDILSEFDQTWTRADFAKIFDLVMKNSPELQAHLTWESERESLATDAGRFLDAAFVENTSLRESTDLGIAAIIAGALLLVGAGISGITMIDSYDSSYDESLKAIPNFFGVPRKFLKRLTNPHYRFAHVDSNRAPQLAAVLTSLATRASALEKLIQDCASRYPEVDAQLKDCYSEDGASLPTANTIIRHFMFKVMGELFEERRSFREVTTGTTVIDELTVAQRIQSRVDEAHDSGNFLQFMLPVEDQKIQALKKKKKRTYPESRQLNLHELKKSRIMLTSQTMAYQLARQEYETEAKKLDAIHVEMAEAAKGVGREADDRLVELNIREKGLAAVADLKRQKLEITTELLVRARFLVNKLLESKVRLDAVANQRMFEAAMGDYQDMKTLDQKQLKSDELEKQIMELKVQNLAEQSLLKTEGADEIRAKILSMGLMDSKTQAVSGS